jgi:NADH dehydrogenase
MPWQKSSVQPEIVVGNVLNEEALFRAVTGIHAIIHLENAFWWGRPRQLERIELVGTRQLITAARAARVGRLITVSHLGASPASAYTLMRVKGLVEEGLRASGIAYTVIRSGIVFGEQDSFVNHIAMMMRTNPFFFVMPGHGEVVLHPIYIDDLVRAVARSLELVDTVDRVIEIGGPEYITLEDLVRTVMRVTGTPRMVIPVPPYLLRWVSSLYSRVLPRSLMTPQWFDVLGANRTTKLGNAFSDFGIHPRRLEDTLLTYMPGRSYWWPALRYSMRRRPRGI